jgi:DNA-binding response OmpR family regulator
VTVRSAEFRFAQFRLRPGERALFADDHPVKLGARALDVLLVLIEQREGAVAKAELMARVWPNGAAGGNSGVAVGGLAPRRRGRERRGCVRAVLRAADAPGDGAPA